MSYLADARIILDTARPGTLEEAKFLSLAVVPLLKEHSPDIARVALLVVLDAIDRQEEQQAEQTRLRNRPTL